MLYHLTNALRDEAIKQLKHETGNDPKIDEPISYQEHQGLMPYGRSFKLETFDHRGGHTYVVTIVEIDQ